MALKAPLGVTEEEEFLCMLVLVEAFHGLLPTVAAEAALTGVPMSWYLFWELLLV